MNFERLIVSQHFATICSNSSKFITLFPTWYEYLPCTGDNGSPAFTNINDVWLVLAAVIEILLRIATIAAVGIIIYAGIQYTTSQGNPETTSKALSTIINAAIGLVICILAAAIVTFIAGSFGK